MARLMYSNNIAVLISCLIIERHQVQLYLIFLLYIKKGAFLWELLNFYCWLSAYLWMILQYRSVRGLAWIKLIGKKR